MMRWAMPAVLGIALLMTSWGAVALVISSVCAGAEPPEPIEADPDRVQAELDGRSFRRFEPDRDADERKGVVLDFSDGVTLWAQYAEDGHVVSEWEVRASTYRVESRGEEVTITFVDPSACRQFPEECSACVDTSSVSISIRDVFDAGGIRFRIDDPDGVLPSPFPVFGSWTRFEEDEYLD